MQPAAASRQRARAKPNRSLFLLSFWQIPVDKDMSKFTFFGSTAFPGCAIIGFAILMLPLAPREKDIFLDFHLVLF
jgi:hypothetical protein